MTASILSDSIEWVSRKLGNIVDDDNMSAIVCGKGWLLFIVTVNCMYVDDEQEATISVIFLKYCILNEREVSPIYWGCYCQNLLVFFIRYEVS